MRKLMEASDWDESKVKFPVIAMPKIDGVRGANMGTGLVGRSMKPHSNKRTTWLFSDPIFHGLDGELLVGTDPKAPDLCRNTTSALNTIEGTPHIVWGVFDLVTPETVALPYHLRLEALEALIGAWRDTTIFDLVKTPALNDTNNVAMVGYRTIYTMDALIEYDTANLDAGYEGTIIRDPMGMYKEGRSTVKEGGLLRIKRFIDFEIVVRTIVEGQHNTNVATTNARGQTERSTHKANMVPNGMVGGLTGVILTDVLDRTGKVLFKRGQEVEVSPGCMTHDERKHWFANPHEIIGKVAKVKTFPHGVKDKPRFPTFQSLRMLSDMG